MLHEAGTTAPTCSLGAVSELTGLSPERLRAWERRYGAVAPLRTPGGTRRYRDADVERLRLIKAAVDGGHRIGKVASLPLDELRALAPAPDHMDALGAMLLALDRMDASEAQRLAAIQLTSQGPTRFAREFVSPLAREIGDRWASDRLGIASEHLATAVLRSLLGSALVPSASSLRGPRIAFATPCGERHELGLQMAAVTALGAGANPLYLGGEVPVEDLVKATERTGVDALALSIVHLPRADAERVVAAIRSDLGDGVSLWLGGAAAADLAPREGVEHTAGLEELEWRVARLCIEKRAARR